MRVGDVFRCRRGWILGVALVSVLLIVSSSTVLAGGPLVFVDVGTLGVKETDETVYVALTNSGGEEVEIIKFRVPTLRGPEGELYEQVLNVDIVSVDGRSLGEQDGATLAEFSVGTFGLEFSLTPTAMETLPDSGLPDGIYHGFLVVEASKVEPVQRPLTLEVGDPDTLAFLNGGTLELRDPLEPVHVWLKNSGTEALEDIEFQVPTLHGPKGELVGFDVLSAEGKAIDSRAPQPGEDFFAQRFELIFTSTSTEALPSGIYTGTLEVQALGVKPIQRTLTWQVGRDTLAGLVPDADSLTVGGTIGGCPSPIRHWCTDGGEAKLDDLATLRLYGTDLDKLRPETIDPVSTTLRTEQGQTVVASLTGFKLRSDIELTATLSFSGLTGPGSYTGSLLLVPTEAETSKKVTITALMRDHWVWPLVVIAAGLALSYFVTDWGKRVKPGRDIQRQALVALQGIKKYHTELAGDWDRMPLRGYTIVAGPQERTIIEDVQKKLKQGLLEQANKKLNELEKHFSEKSVEFERQKDSATEAGRQVDVILRSVKVNNLAKAKQELDSLLAFLMTFESYSASSAIGEVGRIIGLLELNDKSELMHALEGLKDYFADTKKDLVQQMEDVAKAQGQVTIILELVNDKKLLEAQGELAELLTLTGGTSEGSAEREVEAILALTAEGEIEKARDKLEAALAYFEAYQIFRADAKSLYNSHNELEKHPDFGDIKLQKLASKLFPGRPVRGPQDLEGLSAQVKELRALYAVFVRIYGRWKIGDGIVEVLKPKKGQMTAPALRVFERAMARLDGVRADLWAAGSTQEVATWRLERKVEWALGQLRVLEERYLKQIAIPWEAEAPTFAGRPVPAAFENEWYAQSLKAIGRFVAALADEPFAVTRLDLNKATPPELKDQAMKLQDFIKTVDKGLFLLSLLVALGTALWFLYAGKAFGTAWDYVAAFLWGAGVDQSLKGLTAVLSKFGVQISA